MYPTYPKLGMRHEAYDDLVSSNRPRLLLTITRWDASVDLRFRIGCGSVWMSNASRVNGQVSMGT